jgi:hypothetical protein
MIGCCPDGTNFVYPLLADVYYPTVEQSAYGNVKKTWMLDSSIPCNFTVAGSKNKQDVIPNPSVTIDNFLIGRTRTDIRISLDETKNAITNIIVTNIRDKSGNSIYLETSGARAGFPTIFEVATNDPIVGPFGDVEYYKVILRRSENQGVDIWESS